MAQQKVICVSAWRAPSRRRATPGAEGHGFEGMPGAGLVSALLSGKAKLAALQPKPLELQAQSVALTGDPDADRLGFEALPRLIAEGWQIRSISSAEGSRRASFAFVLLEKA